MTAMEMLGLVMLGSIISTESAWAQLGADLDGEATYDHSGHSRFPIL